MSAAPVVTRFAPSPSGDLHLGNARTALFNALLARRGHGAFLLRIEDTDAARSRPEHVLQLQADLQWLGLAWEGEPLHQSQRSDVYTGLLAQLESRGALFAAAAGAAGDNDFAAISTAARAATGLRGRPLFKPLRAALTGRLSGPELAPLLRAMPDGAARQRLARFA